jgi:hypothetical protein
LHFFYGQGWWAFFHVFFGHLDFQELAFIFSIFCF